MKNGLLVINLRKVGLAVALLLILAGIAFPVYSLIENHAIIANFLIAEYAHLQAGDKIKFSPEYTELDLQDDWGIYNNSQWLFDWTEKIVPILVYDNISVGEGMYPKVVAFQPRTGDRSFTNGGTTVLSFWNWQYVFVVTINDRYVIDKYMNDERAVLYVLVHELIHVQMGNFIGQDPRIFEPKTEAASVEALGALCNMGSELACKSFWYAIEQLSKSSLQAQMKNRGIGGIYDFLVKLLWIDKTSERVFDKQNRYWSKNQSDYLYLNETYDLRPWELIICGVWGNRIDTGLIKIIQVGDKEIPVVMGMPFDDTKALLGLWQYIVYWVMH